MKPASPGMRYYLSPSRFGNGIGRLECPHRRAGEQVTAIIPALRNITAETVNGVVKEIEDMALSAGTVTRDGLERMLTEVLEKAGVNNVSLP